MAAGNQLHPSQCPINPKASLLLPRQRVGNFLQAQPHAGQQVGQNWGLQCFIDANPFGFAWFQLWFPSQCWAVPTQCNARRCGDALIRTVRCCC